MNTHNGAQVVEAAPEPKIATRTLLVQLLETDRRANTLTYVQKAIGVGGVARHFNLTVKMKPKFWRKFLKAGPPLTGTMLCLTLEQGQEEDHICTYAADFSLPADSIP